MSNALRETPSLWRSIGESLWALRGAAALDTVTPTEPSVRYRTPVGRGIAPLIDLYLPAPSLAKGGAALLVHGGGFVIGSRQMKPMRHLASRLHRAGLAVGALDYRMIFRGGRLDEALDDVRAGLAFFRTWTIARGLDPARISLVGLSAGATLAMLVAAGGDAGAIHRLVCCFGLYEIDHLTGPLRSVLPRLLFRTPDPAVWRARCPRNAPQPTTPTLLLHGAEDGVIPVEQAHRLAAHRESLGLPTRLVVYPDASHGFFSRPSRVADEAAREIIDHLR